MDEVIVSQTKTIRYWLEERTVYIVHRDDGRKRERSVCFADTCGMFGNSWAGTEVWIYDSAELARARIQAFASK